MCRTFIIRLSPFNNRKIYTSSYFMPAININQYIYIMSLLTLPVVLPSSLPVAIQEPVTLEDLPWVTTTANNYILIGRHNLPMWQQLDRLTSLHTHCPFAIFLQTKVYDVVKYQWLVVFWLDCTMFERFWLLSFTCVSGGIDCLDEPLGEVSTSVDMGMRRYHFEQLWWC